MPKLVGLDCANKYSNGNLRTITKPIDISSCVIRLEKAFFKSNFLFTTDDNNPYDVWKQLNDI